MINMVVHFFHRRKNLVQVIHIFFRPNPQGLVDTIKPWDSVPHPARGMIPLDPHSQKHVHAFAISGPGHDALVGVLGATPPRS